MNANAVWVRESGKTEIISEMQENHLMNAYAKSVREAYQQEVRPDLAAEIVKRDLVAQLPDYAARAVRADAGAVARQFVY